MSEIETLRKQNAVLLDALTSLVYCSQYYAHDSGGSFLKSWQTARSALRYISPDQVKPLVESLEAVEAALRVRFQK